MIYRRKKIDRNEPEAISKLSHIREHDLAVTLSLVMVTISGVSERSFDGAGLVQFMGKAKSKVSLPTRGHQISDNPIKDQSAALDSQRLRD